MIIVKCRNWRWLTAWIKVSEGAWRCAFFSLNWERELKIWYIYLYAHNKITIDSKLSLYSSGKKKSFIQSSEALAVCAKRIKTIVVLSPLNVTWIKSLAELCAWKNGLIFNQYQRSVVQNNEVSIQTLQHTTKKGLETKKNS